jgi:hypothetical protein
MKIPVMNPPRRRHHRRKRRATSKQLAALKKGRAALEKIRSTKRRKRRAHRKAARRHRRSRQTHKNPIGIGEILTMSNPKRRRSRHKRSHRRHHHRRRSLDAVPQPGRRRRLGRHVRAARGPQGRVHQGRAGRQRGLHDPEPGAHAPAGLDDQLAGESPRCPRASARPSPPAACRRRRAPPPTAPCRPRTAPTASRCSPPSGRCWFRWRSGRRRSSPLRSASRAARSRSRPRRASACASGACRSGPASKPLEQKPRGASPGALPERPRLRLNESRGDHARERADAEEGNAVHAQRLLEGARQAAPGDLRQAQGHLRLRRRHPDRQRRDRRRRDPDRRRLALPGGGGPDHLEPAERAQDLATVQITESAAAAAGRTSPCRCATWPAAATSAST